VKNRVSVGDALRLSLKRIHITFFGIYSEIGEIVF
jgi:hypothetical protein